LDGTIRSGCPAIYFLARATWITIPQSERTYPNSITQFVLVTGMLTPLLFVVSAEKNLFSRQTSNVFGMKTESFLFSHYPSVALNVVKLTARVSNLRNVMIL
jgi:hypothetical protein